MVSPRLTTTLTAAALLLAFAGPATAAPPTPQPAESGVAQYVETVPAGGGASAQGVGKASTSRLSKKLAERIDARGGNDAPALKKLVTSSVYGAPRQSLSSATQGGQQTAAGKPAPVLTSSSGTGGLKWLGLGLAVLTIGAVGAFMATRAS
jgi:hypothetical protein